MLIAGQSCSRPTVSRVCEQCREAFEALRARLAPAPFPMPHRARIHAQVGKSGTCGPLIVERYLARLSGPLLDRIDPHLEVPAVPYRELSIDRSGGPNAAIRQRVNRARERQHERFADVAARVRQEVRRTGRAFKAIINQALRCGLGIPEREPPGF